VWIGNDQSFAIWTGQPESGGENARNAQGGSQAAQFREGNHTPHVLDSVSIPPFVPGRE